MLRLEYGWIIFFLCVLAVKPVTCLVPAAWRQLREFLLGGHHSDHPGLGRNQAAAATAGRAGHQMWPGLGLGWL